MPPRRSTSSKKTPSKKLIVEDEEELRRSTSPQATTAADINAVGTSSRFGRGQRPKYPSVLDGVVYPLWRTAIVSLFGCMLMHFVINPVVTPPIYHLFMSPAVQNFLKTNSFCVWLASPNSWPGARMAARGQDINDLVFFAYGMGITHGFVYIAVTATYYCCDRFKLAEGRRIPYASFQQPSSALIRRTIAEAALTVFITGPAFLAVLFVLFGKFSHVKSLDDLTAWKSASFPVQVLHFMGAHLANNVAFYLVHRAVHEVPGAYALIHKQHHSWLATNTGGIAAEYASPLESIFANVLPTMLWCLMLSGHGLPQTFQWTYLQTRLIETLGAHSGYDDRGSLLYHIGLLHGTAAHHSHHHTINKGNYGHGAALEDWIAGTMDWYLIPQKNAPLAPAQIDGPYDRFGQDGTKTK